MKKERVINKELKRLKKLPTKGVFTFLHHSMPIEKTEDLWERIDCILNEKPPEEHYPRLRHIYFIPTATADKYWAERKSLYDKYEAEKKSLDDKYWAERKSLDDKYEAEKKSLDDKYWAERKSLDDKYWAERKSLDDKDEAERKPLDDKYWAERKSLDDKDEAERKPLLNLILALIPDCAWDGETILGRGER